MIRNIIDYFTSSNLVSPLPQPPLLETSKYSALPTCQYNHDTKLNLNVPHPQTIPYGFMLTQATVGLFLIFTISRACNMGHTFLMRISGALCSSFPLKHSSNLPPRLANCCLSPQTNLCCNSLARSQVLSRDDDSWRDSTRVCCSWRRALYRSLISASPWRASLQCSRSLVQTTACLVSLSQDGDKYSGYDELQWGAIVN